MQDVNVVVLFQSRGEWIERLAHAAAVGAVQGRANIRLRRWGDAPDASATAAGDMEYIAPRESDLEWADAILAGMPAEAAGGLAQYFDSLNLAGKIGASFTEGPGTASLQAAMRRAGLTTVEMLSEPDALTCARLQGRRVADAARSLRAFKKP